MSIAAPTTPAAVSSEQQQQQQCRRPCRFPIAAIASVDDDDFDAIEKMGEATTACVIPFFGAMTSPATCACSCNSLSSPSSSSSFGKLSSASSANDEAADTETTGTSTPSSSEASLRPHPPAPSLHATTTTTTTHFIHVPHQHIPPSTKTTTTTQKRHHDVVISSHPSTSSIGNDDGRTQTTKQTSYSNTPQTSAMTEQQNQNASTYLVCRPHLHSSCHKNNNNNNHLLFRNPLFAATPNSSLDWREPKQNNRFCSPHLRRQPLLKRAKRAQQQQQCSSSNGVGVHHPTTTTTIDDNDFIVAATTTTPTRTKARRWCWRGCDDDDGGDQQGRQRLLCAAANADDEGWKRTLIAAVAASGRRTTKTPIVSTLDDDKDNDERGWWWRWPKSVPSTCSSNTNDAASRCSTRKMLSATTTTMTARVAAGLLVVVVILLLLVALLALLAASPLRDNAIRGDAAAADDDDKFSRAKNVTNRGEGGGQKYGRNEEGCWSTSSVYDQLIREDFAKQRQISSELINEMRQNGSARILESLKWIAAEVHVAGTPEQLRLMERLETEYRGLGLSVRRYEYDVLLSYPDYERPNTVHRWRNDDRGKRTTPSAFSSGWELVSGGRGTPLGTNDDPDLLEQQRDPRAFVWWTAYARPGVVVAGLVYAGYGAGDDYRQLAAARVSVRGRIVLVRQGGTFRGWKVAEAERRGAVGVILYADPADYVPSSASATATTFPRGIWLPPNEAQRGTLYRGDFGDPATPGIPAKPYAPRAKHAAERLRAAGKLPRIPVTSISYADAERIFSLLDGQPVPWSGWNGTLNIVYRLTGTTMFRLEVRARSETRRIRNFVATMRGREEPDQWVLVGNHADAWTHGSVDPGTGTATMLQLARQFTSYRRTTGWRPRRSICFAQWDAEEFGLIGSTEWVEEMLPTLQRRAVAYVNVDHLPGGDVLAAKAVPSLFRLLVDAASRVPHPQQRDDDAAEGEQEQQQLRLLDAWRRATRPRTALPGDRHFPHIQLPTVGGSDFYPFIVLAGVPVADLRMEAVPVQHSYTVYHTAYEIPWLADRLLDPHRRVYGAFGAFWAEVVRQLADNLVVPLNVEDQAVALGDQVQRLGAHLTQLGLAAFVSDALAALTASVAQFHRRAADAQRVLRAVDAGERALTLGRLRALNDRLLSVERCFVAAPPTTTTLVADGDDEAGVARGAWWSQLPRRAQHVIYGPSVAATEGSSSSNGRNQQPSAFRSTLLKSTESESDADVVAEENKLTDDDNAEAFAAKMLPLQQFSTSASMAPFAGVTQPALEWWKSARRVKSAADERERERWLERVRDALARVQWAIEAATTTLDLSDLDLAEEVDRDDAKNGGAKS